MVMPAGKNVKTFDGSLMLNDTGAFIFERLQKGDRPETIAEAMTQLYDVDCDTVRGDIQKVLDSLIEAGVADA